ncbi:MAG: hypothetical protein NC541_05500 [bacterium]|nr:hypothetical protein [bacterium]
MQEGSWFQKALTDFTWEAANGGAIRHLADLGYTVEEIRKELTFPASYETVRNAVWKHLLDTGVVLRENPRERRAASTQAEYIREYDQYGRPSFRRAAKASPAGNTCRLATEWRERKLSEGKPLDILLREKTAENGVENSYLSCDFGEIAVKKPEELRELLQILDPRQREYIEGLPWEKRRVYHRLTPCMTGIVLRLYRAGKYRGIFCFLKTGEWVEVGEQQEGPED